MISQRKDIHVFSTKGRWNTVSNADFRLISEIIGRWVKMITGNDY